MDTTNKIVEKMADRDYAGQLWRLAGLTLQRYLFLSAARAGTLVRINPATRLAMGALIGKDLRITDAGLRLLGVCDAFDQADWYCGPRTALEINGDVMSLLRVLQDWRDGRLRKRHLQAMVACYNSGVLSANYLGAEFGQATAQEMIAFGWLRAAQMADCPGWEIFDLQPAGMSVVQDYEILMHGGAL